MSKSARSFVGKPIKRFVRKEDGNIATFSILLFSLMVMCGGLAVDLMRYEHVRTSLQQTLDRCTLAAAALKQTLDRNAVCRDYAAKAGLNIPASSVTVTTGQNFAEVQVLASIKQPTIFAGMLGIYDFDVPARSSAIQAVTNVEIAMVLDVSRSMILPDTKLASLKVAAKEFVTTVLAADTENRTSIAIVPYNGQVNLGSVLAAKYNVSPKHDIVANVNCVDLPPSVYNTNTLSRTLAMPQTGYVDAFSSTELVETSPGYWAFSARNQWRSPTSTDHATPNELNRWCPPQPTNIVRLPNNNVGVMHTQIEALVGIGATSINAGLKWGMAMLDPANRTMFTELRTAGHIPSTIPNRPFDYTVTGDPSPDTMKIILLMTDGSHFAESRLNTAFRSGNSPIWKSTDGIYSIRHDTGRPAIAGTDRFFVPSLCSAPDSNITANVSTACDAWKSSAQGSSPKQLTWPEVFKDLRLAYVAWQFYGRALGTDNSTRQTAYNNARNAMRTTSLVTDMDAQLQTVCNDARSRNVIVYGVAFEAPAEGRTQIQQCATSSTHYYEASTLNVATAFKSIATRISQLRLTQ